MALSICVPERVLPTIHGLARETQTPDYWVHTIDMWAAGHNIAISESMDLQIYISSANHVLGFRSSIRCNTYEEQ